MSVQIYNFPDTIEGSTFAGTIFTVLVNQAVSDLTGSYIKMQLRANGPDGNLIREFDTTGIGGITLTDPSNGVFAIDKFDVDMPPSVLLHDIVITYANGDIKKWVRGSWCIINAVTE